MSGQVASHTRGLPFFHGIIVTPSGRFPLVRARPDGSSLEGTRAVVRALCTMSLITLALVSMPVFCSLLFIFSI